MALPKIKTPEYYLVVPSTGQEITYRPFLVGEEKILLMALESEDEKQIYSSLMNIVQACTNGIVGKPSDPVFDLEYVFLKIRGKSVSESIKLNILCPDDEKTYVESTLNTDDIQVLVEENHKNEIELNDEFKVIMKYPSVKDTMDAGKFTSDTEKGFYVIKNCIETIVVGEDIYNKVDISQKELDEFFDSMTQDMFVSLQEFFEGMPSLKHDIEITNPNTNVTSTVTMEGLKDFFG